jgi:hypothetical protein
VTALGRATDLNDPAPGTPSGDASGGNDDDRTGVLVARHPALHSIGLTSLLGIDRLLAVFTIVLARGWERYIVMEI